MFRQNDAMLINVNGDKYGASEYDRNEEELNVSLPRSQQQLMMDPVMTLDASIDTMLLVT